MGPLSVMSSAMSSAHPAAAEAAEQDHGYLCAAGPPPAPVQLVVVEQRLGKDGLLRDHQREEPGGFRHVTML